MRKFIKKIFKPGMPDKPGIKSINTILQDAIDQAQRTKKAVLYSNLPAKEILKIVNEIIYLIDVLLELQAEEDRLWQLSCLTKTQLFLLF